MAADGYFSVNKICDRSNCFNQYGSGQLEVSGREQPPPSVSSHKIGPNAAGTQQET
jgi:hypothetical protein